MAAHPAQGGGASRPRSRAARTAARVLEAGLELLFACLTAAMRASVALYFRRLDVVHRERFPSHGPVLVVANHPATWTDVVILDVALGRKLHYLAQSTLYRPRARAVLLALHGAMPLTPSHDSPDAADRNAETFRRCHELFDRGGVVAVFPEGLSTEDRRVRALRPGAARIALGYAPPPPAARLALVPVGIHYADRTAFRSDVVVSVGDPVALGGFLDSARHDHEAAVQALTSHLHRRLSGLILNLPEPRLAAAVADLVPLAPGAGGPRQLERVRRLGTWLERLADADPPRFERIRRHRRAYGRARRALALSDRSLLWRPATARWRRRTALLIVLCVLGALPALAGSIAHAVPWRLGEAIARRVAPEPPRVAFARISSGSVLFPATYGVYAWVLVRALGMSAISALGWLVALALLGSWVLVYGRWAGELRERLRLRVLARSHPRLLERARAERSALARMLAGALAAGPGVDPGSGTTEVPA